MKRKALQLFICAVIVLYIFFIKARRPSGGHRTVIKKVDQVKG